MKTYVFCFAEDDFDDCRIVGHPFAHSISLVFIKTRKFIFKVEVKIKMIIDVIINDGIKLRKASTVDVFSFESDMLIVCVVVEQIRGSG